MNTAAQPLTLNGAITPVQPIWLNDQFERMKFIHLKLKIGGDEFSILRADGVHYHCYIMDSVIMDLEKIGLTQVSVVCLTSSHRHTNTGRINFGRTPGEHTGKNWQVRHH